MVVFFSVYRQIKNKDTHVRRTYLDNERMNRESTGNLDYYTRTYIYIISCRSRPLVPGTVLLPSEINRSVLFEIRLNHVKYRDS